jgi:hypothetical protein
LVVTTSAYHLRRQKGWAMVEFLVPYIDMTNSGFLLAEQNVLLILISGEGWRG